MREIYSNYVHKQIKENNEIVLVNPFYETTDSVRQVLSKKYDHGVSDICKYEKEESLIIALEELLGDQPLIYVKKGLANYAKWERTVFQFWLTWAHILIDPSTRILLVISHRSNNKS
jgi:hypothetical protein